MKKIAIFIPLFSTILNALSLEKSSDVLALLIPAGSFVYSYYYDDNEGQKEFLESICATVATTYALKFATKQERPNRKNNRSFPSGHTSITFASSAYIDKRYRFRYAVPLYLASGFVGYSRVWSHNHHKSDVYAGALIGIACSYYFSTRYKGVSIKPALSSDAIGISFKKEF